MQKWVDTSIVLGSPDSERSAVEDDTVKFKCGSGLFRSVQLFSTGQRSWRDEKNPTYLDEGKVPVVVNLTLLDGIFLAIGHTLLLHEIVEEILNLLLLHVLFDTTNVQTVVLSDRVTGRKGTSNKSGRDAEMGRRRNSTGTIGKQTFNLSVKLDNI